MALPTTYTQAFNLLGDFFSNLRDAQAPPKFTNQLLKDIGYESSNHRPFIPILKSLGFLTADGTPTSRYHEYRNHSLSKKIMGKAIKEAYSDIFLIKSNPTTADKPLIEGKFKSYHNTSDVVAGLMTKTFFSLLELADLSPEETSALQEIKTPNDSNPRPDVELNKQPKASSLNTLGLHYNIQVHLPATKDIEVYNSIFKSLKNHLLE